MLQNDLKMDDREDYISDHENYDEDIDYDYYVNEKTESEAEEEAKAYISASMESNINEEININYDDSEYLAMMLKQLNVKEAEEYLQFYFSQIKLE